MKLFTKSIALKLVKNGMATAAGNEADNPPVVKLFNPTGGQTWLISEIDESGQILYGLCDMGFGCPELGDVALSDLTGFRGMFGLPIERDRSFKTTRPMSEYAAEAREAGRIQA